MKLHLGRMAFRMAKRAAHHHRCQQCGYSWQARDAFAVRACPRCGFGRDYVAASRQATGQLVPARPLSPAAKWVRGIALAAGIGMMLLVAGVIVAFCNQVIESTPSVPTPTVTSAAAAPALVPTPKPAPKRR